MWGRLLPVVVVGTVLGLAGCGSGSDSGAQTAAPPAPERVADLDSVLELRAAFNDDRGTPRLLLLLSPT